MKITLKTAILVVTSLLLTGCKIDPVRSVYPVKSRQASRLNTVQTAGPNSIIYKNINVNTYESIRLTESARVKSKSILGPRLSMKYGTRLVHNLENEKYAFYTTRKRYDKLDEILVRAFIALGPRSHQPSIQGLRKNKASGNFDGFVINEFGQYKYALPKKVKWKKTVTIPTNKKGNAETIKFIGVQGKEMQFEHYDFLNKPRIFGSKTKKDLKKMTLPTNAKTITIGQHEIEILKVDKDSITYKVLT